MPVPKAVRGLVPSGRLPASRRGPTIARRADDTADAGAVGTAAPSRGIEEPSEIAQTIALVERSFAFVDLCGFTKFIAANGEHAAIDTLTQFRSLARDISNRRGVMVAKWLGDGAMIVGLEIGPTVATAAELIGRYDGSTLALRGGFGNGQALIMDGDDYIGRPANLAARTRARRPDRRSCWPSDYTQLSSRLGSRWRESGASPCPGSVESVEPSASVLSPISSCRPSPVTMLPTPSKGPPSGERRHVLNRGG